MGFGLERAVGTVNSNLVCPICLGILQDPVQDPKEHSFCKVCIHQWLQKNVFCPVDRTTLTFDSLLPPSRLLQNLLADIELACEFKAGGCTVVLKLKTMQHHVLTCEFNPDKPIECPNACGLLIPKNQLESHNCIHQLRREIKELANVVSTVSEQFRKELNQIKNQMSELTTNVYVLRRDETFRIRCTEFLNNLMNRPKGTIRDLDSIVETYECDDHVRDFLEQLKCPIDIVQQLIKNCNESNWPGPLTYSAARKIHEAQIKTYICYDVAKSGYVVLILPCFNRHLPLHFNRDPGFLVKLRSYDCLIRS